MLPAYRTEGEAFAIPKFELTPQDVNGFLDELRAFHHHFRACFARSEPREHFFNYMVGQCSALERKSIEPMALHVEGGNIRGMQRCMSDDVWDEDHMRQTYHALVADEMGDPEGVLMFDESGFVKKGKDSVGVGFFIGMRIATWGNVNARKPRSCNNRLPAGKGYGVASAMGFSWTRPP